jgi:hypothetical protein
MNMVATRARVAGSRAAAAFLALAIALVVGLVPHLALAQKNQWLLEVDMDYLQKIQHQHKSFQ